jgi:hypothetical protein
MLQRSAPAAQVEDFGPLPLMPVALRVSVQKYHAVAQAVASLSSAFLRPQPSVPISTWPRLIWILAADHANLSLHPL